jgi:hypothetical protein
MIIFLRNKGVPASMGGNSNEKYPSVSDGIKKVNNAINNTPEGAIAKGLVKGYQVDKNVLGVPGAIIGPGAGAIYNSKKFHDNQLKVNKND